MVEIKAAAFGLACKKLAPAPMIRGPPLALAPVSGFVGCMALSTRQRFGRNQTRDSTDLCLEKEAWRMTPSRLCVTSVSCCLRKQDHQPQYSTSTHLKKDNGMLPSMPHMKEEHFYAV